MSASISGLSDIVCQSVADTSYNDLSAATRDSTKRALLDATGVIVAASGLSADIAPFVGLSRTSQGPCALLGFEDLVSPPMAAFGNGAMAHALDFEDAFEPSPCHPNASAIPAAIAIAQGYGPVHGRDLITAIAIGCNLACRLGLSLRQGLDENGWYPPILLGAFGAAAVAAKLLRLSAEQVRDALSLTLCQVTAPGEIKNSEGTVIRAVREAFPAHAAVVSALLARDGVRGFEAPLEGQDGFYGLYANGQFEPAEVADGLQSPALIEQLSFKPWPSCRGTHAYIEIGLALRQEHGFAWQDIDSIVVEVGRIQQMLVEPLQRKQAPRTIIDAKFSIPFTLALSLVRGRVGLEDFAADVLSDADILDLAGKVSPHDNPDWGLGHASSGALTIRLLDGRVFSGQVENALGSPQAPIGTDDLRKKFLDCCGHAATPFAAGRADAIASDILSIERSPDSGSCFHFRASDFTE